jgi:type II secretory pathway pseudopilin PulG
MLIAMVLLLVISAVVFQVINMSTERSATEQVKLDMFQEAREFMDQMTRDLRLAGYPNRRNFALNVLISPLINDSRAAVGLVKVDSGELWFEGDVDGTGTVSVVHYYLDTSTTNNCPCLKRSMLPKINGDPLTGQTTPSYQVEVQGVTNTNIFSAYSDATSLSLPLNIGGNASSIASIDTVMATLSLQASTVDPKTKTKPETTLVTTVKMNNCSPVAPLQETSCN